MVKSVEKLDGKLEIFTHGDHQEGHTYTQTHTYIHTHTFMHTDTHREVYPVPITYHR